MLISPIPSQGQDITTATHRYLGHCSLTRPVRELPAQTSPGPSLLTSARHLSGQPAHLTSNANRALLLHIITNPSSPNSKTNSNSILSKTPPLLTRAVYQTPKQK
jgi:hypothetical protein